MMSKKQWLALLALFLTYLLLGAGVFYSIEHPLEQRRRGDELREREMILALVRQFYHSNESELLEEMSRYCGRPISREAYDMEALEPELWTFYNSFFFVITVVSTIGYGNLAPTAMLSRLLMILYALVGIPMNGILLASLAEFFSKTLVRARARHKHQSVGTLFGDLLRYLLPGAVVFLLLPAALFMYVEQWSYDKAVYYAFVTLTTIGFGDIVAGQTSRGDDGPYHAYRAFLVVWIIFGLGYLLMLLGLISRALRGKRMARLEHALAAQLRGAEKRVARDLRYMRRVLNELYLQKLKPVYRDEDACSASGLRARSASEPSLAGLVAASPRPRRTRICSEGAALGPHGADDHEEHADTEGQGLRRTASDSALGRIDRAATFAAPSAAVAPARLLARFVSALAAPQRHRQEEEFPGARAAGGGVHGFCDADILRSERGGGGRWWTVGPGGGDLEGLGPLPRGGVPPPPPPGTPPFAQWPQPPPAYTDSPRAARVLNGVSFANGAGGGRRSLDASAHAEWTWSAPFAASQLVHRLDRAQRKAQTKDKGKGWSPGGRKAAEAGVGAGAGGLEGLWWGGGAGAEESTPPGRRGKRQSIAAVALSHLSRLNPLRRGGSRGDVSTREGGGEEDEDEDGVWRTWAPGAKRPAPASPPPKPRAKSKSVADVFFFQRATPQPGEEQLEAEARVDALLEGTSLADLFRAVDALRRRDAAARAQRGQPPLDASPPSSSRSSSEDGSPKGRSRRKLGTAPLTPPYASLTSLFVPPQERKGSQPNVQGLSSRRRSASPAALALALSSIAQPQSAQSERRRPSLRPGATAARAAALFQRRPSAPHAMGGSAWSSSPQGSLQSLASAPSPGAVRPSFAQLQLRRGSLRPPSPSPSPWPSPAGDKAPPSPLSPAAYLKRGARRFSVRPVPPSALATIPSASPSEAASPTATAATSPSPSEPPSPQGLSGPGAPPPPPATPPPDVSLTPSSPLPVRMRDLRTQLLQRHLSSEALHPPLPPTQRPRRDSLRDVVVHKP